MDTSGFYKKADNGEILFAPNFVHMPGKSLVRDNPSDKLESFNGWQWFESQEQAFIAYASVAQPDVITRMQAKLALHNAGLLPTVLAVVDQADAAAQIAWADAEVFMRDSPLLNQLATAAGITPEQLDTLFAAAKQIRV